MLLNQVQEVALSSLAFQVTIHKSRLKNNKHFKTTANLEKSWLENNTIIIRSSVALNMFWLVFRWDVKLLSNII